MQSKLYLRIWVDKNYQPHVLDQNDREMEGVLAIRSDYDVGEIPTFWVQLHAYDKNGEIITLDSKKRIDPSEGRG